MMGWYQGGMGWGGWLVMSLLMVAFWGLVVLAVLMIFRGTSGGPAEDGSAPARDPMRTLDERYARGEIGTEEYLARRDVLRAGAGGGAAPAAAGERS